MSARPREARARAWLDRAIDEMELAKDLADNWRGNLEHAGVHAQQAAEKAIKAGLILQLSSKMARTLATTTLTSCATSYPQIGGCMLPTRRLCIA